MTGKRNNRECSECGHPLPAGLPSLMCPQCLLAGALIEEVEMPDSEGRMMGDWHLLEEIGRGGMGVVYRAQRIDGGPEVALKTLVLGELAGPEVLRRFRQEVKAAAALQHPHLVAIHEVGQQDGVPFLVMALIEGCTLAEQLERGAMPPREAATLMRSVAGAVSCIHENGILHRDLKPSNVLMDEEGKPFVSDFGLARHLQSASLTERTRTGQVLGSPAYMPPEQARGDNARTGPASDVYALGAIFYHMLTGRAPFAGNSVHDVLRQVEISEPPPARTIQAGVPRDLETICIHCMEKEPAARCPSAQALSDDLGRWLAGRPVLARRPGRARRAWRWCRRRPVIASLGFITLMLLTVLAVNLFLTKNVSETHRRQQQARDRAEALAEARSVLASREPGRRSRGLAAVKRAACEEFREELRDTAMALLSSYSFEPSSSLALPPGARAAAFSSSLNEAAYAFDGRIYILSTKDGSPLLSFDEADSRTPEDGAPEMLEFSEDGRLFAVQSARGLLRVWTFSNFTANRDAGPPDPDKPAGVKFHRRWQTAASVASGFLPAFTPHGKGLALRFPPGETYPKGALGSYGFATGRLRIIQDGTAPGDFALVNPNYQQFAVCRDGVLHILTLEELNPVAVIEAPSRITRCAWQGNGQRIVAGCANGAVLLYSKFSNFADPLNCLRHSAPLSQLGFSGDEMMLATSSEDGFSRVSTGVTNQVFLELSGFTGHGFSADGSRLAAVEGSSRIKLWQKVKPAGVVRIEGTVTPRFESWEIDLARRSGTLLMDSTPNAILKNRAGQTVSIWAWEDRTRGGAFTPDETMLVTNSAGGFRTINMDSMFSFGSIEPSIRSVSVDGEPAWKPHRFCFGKSGLIAAESADSRYWVGQWPEMNAVRELKGRRASGLPGAGGGPGGSGALAVSPDGAWVAGGLPETGSAVIWDARAGTVAKELPDTGAVHFSPDGRWFLLGGESEWRLYETGTWREHWTLPRKGSARQLGVAAFAEDGRSLLLDTVPFQLTLVDAASARVLANFPLPDAVACTSVRLDSKAGCIYAGTRSNAVYRWDLDVLRKALRDLDVEPGF